MAHNKTFGDKGEFLAAAFLQKQGFEILTRNYRNALGEIDIIAKDKDAVVFVEVKTRMSPDDDSAMESVTPYKQRNIARVAMSYLKERYRSVDVDARFDVIAVYDGAEGTTFEHIPNAFELA